VPPVAVTVTAVVPPLHKILPALELATNNGGSLIVIFVTLTPSF
jgi:hypothetical protein